MSCINKISDSQAVILWNDFLNTIPEIIPVSFNPSLYKFYDSYYNWKPYYLILWDQGEIKGVLPLVNTGKAWVSLPHFSYGGIVLSQNNLNGRNIIVENVISEIISLEIPGGFYIYDLELSLKKEHFNNSYKVFCRALNFNALTDSFKSEKVASVLQLPDNEEELSVMIGANLRRKIRKAKKSGLSVSVGGAELLDVFYSMYIKNIQYLGSINYGKDFFKELITSFDHGCIKIFIAFMKGKPVGAGLLAAYSRFYENLFFATDKAYRKFYVADMLHWEMSTFSINDIPDNLPLAKKRNCVYSFGRSTSESTVHNFKQHWPVKDLPLYYRQINYSTKNSDWHQKVWKTIPNRITCILGPRLIKHIY